MNGCVIVPQAYGLNATVAITHRRAEAVEQRREVGRTDGANAR